MLTHNGLTLLTLLIMYPGRIMRDSGTHTEGADLGMEVHNDRFKPLLRACKVILWLGTFGDVPRERLL